MLDRHFVESFLRLNNADAKMSDAEVRAVLARAGWAESEIGAAIALLRSNVPGATMAQNGGAGMTAFRPDMEFSSAQLSSLLGVDVNIDPSKMHHPAGFVSDSKRALVRLIMGASVIFLAVGLAALLGLGTAYYLQIGPFDPTAI